MMPYIPEMTQCIRPYIQKMTYTDDMCQQKEEEDMPALRLHQYKDCIRKSRERQITATRNNTNDTISRKQKWTEKQL